MSTLQGINSAREYIQEAINRGDKAIAITDTDSTQSFFDANDVRYVDNICLTGKSKLTTHYDFAIARSKKSAERFIKVVNNMDLNAARNIIFAWNDTKDMRQPEAKLYAFIQNTDKKISDDAIGALKEYEIKPALWSKKDSYISELIA